MSEMREVSARPKINTSWPPSGRFRRTVLGIAGLTAAAGTIMVLSANGAGAAPTANAPSKSGVTLCHRTGAVNNPYVKIHVAENSINQLIFGKNGHNSHKGPIFDPDGGKNQPAWGDIIPAFDWGHPSRHYDGLNVPEGQSILDNDCKFPQAPPTTEPPTTEPPTTEPPTTEPPTTEPPTTEPPTTEPPTTEPVTSASSSLGISGGSTSVPTSHGIEPTSATSTAPIPAGVSAGLHTPIANAGLKAWGTALMVLGGAAGLLAGLWPTRRRAH